MVFGARLLQKTAMLLMSHEREVKASILFNNPQKYIVSSCHGFNFLPHYLSRAPTPHKGCLEAVRYPSGI